ncbi:hypothetical protein R1sor_025515 [Riccia sorocarpa]|uniref:Uncharacterized protein n=1 Tax=Riccia sorocarpa TaxID=122646 RepID=A0ABD3GAE5_9MARC
MALRTRNVGRKRKERSPIVEFPPEDVEELIDLTVSKIVETVEEDESSKHNSAAPASTAIEVYRPPGALQTLDDARRFVTLEELSLLERDEVYPYLDLSHLQHDKGFVNIRVALFSRGTRPGIDVYTVDLSESGLKKLVDFPAMGQCSQVVRGWNIDELRYFAKSGRDPALDKKCKLVMRQALKTIGRTSHIYYSTTVAFLAIAHVDPELENLRPDWHAWCANEIRFRLRHSKTDKHSKAKFREGWQAVVELVTSEFLARQAARLQQQSQVLQLEYSSDAKNAFAETKVVWDAESVFKVWGLGMITDNVQGELAGIRSLMEAPRSVGEDVADLKRQLQEKEEQLKRLHDADQCQGHVSYVCSCFGVNFLTCWEENCGSVVSLSWMKEFVLDREVTLTALEERMACSLDIRSLPPSEFDTDEGMSIEGIPTMRMHKEWRYELKAAMTNKTTAFVRNIKTTRLRLSSPPHCVQGKQFRKWDRTKDGVKCADWAILWGYPSNKYWIICSQSPRHKVNNHNRCLETVNFDVPRGDLHSELLRRLNMALCIRLRRHDGIFLEFFVRSLLSLPWALDILNTLVEKEFVTVWRTREIPISVLESKNFYKAEDVCLALKPLWSVSKVWMCDDLAHSRKETTESDSESEHKCQPPPKLPSDICLWLP